MFYQTHKSTIDLILTNKGNCFEKTKVTETGLSNFHKLINTFLRSHFSRLKPKAIYYRNYKKFNEQNVLEDVKNTNFCFNSDDPSENCELITDFFSKNRKQTCTSKKEIPEGQPGTFYK